MLDLGALSTSEGSDQSFALGVNNADEVVGYSFADSNQVGFIYRNGVMTNLNDMIDAAHRYLIYAATAINDRGEIVASAFDYKSNAFRAVLLTPRKPVTH
jgi:probable HAF family extracellular repeat protein